MDLSELEPKSNMSKIGEDNTVVPVPEDTGTTVPAAPALAKTPMEEWQEELAEQKMTRDDAARIVDAILVKGFHEESYRVNKTLFALRTRSTADADRVMEILHEQRPSSTAHYSHLVSRINLASSLVKFGPTVFAHTAPAQGNREVLDKEWKERYRFITTLPSPVFYLLTQILQRFDQKVTLAGDARSIENF